jgi:hypothetical protein
MRLSPATNAPKTLRPEKNLAKKTALPPCLAKNRSAPARRSGVILT